MRYLLIILLFLSLGATAQTVIPTGAVNQLTYQRGGYGADSVLGIPVRDTLTSIFPTFRMMGRITVRPQDGLLYIHNGTKWGVVTGGGGGSTDTTSLSNRIDQRVKYTDTSAMLAAYQASLLTKVKYSDTSAMLANYQAMFSRIFDSLSVHRTAIDGKVPMTRNITINGVTQNLSTDRTWTVSGTDTTSLSARINLKKDKSDSINYDGYTTVNRFKTDSAAKVAAIALKLNIADTNAFVRKPFILNVNGAEGNFTDSRLDLTVGYVAYSGHADNADVALYSNATDSTKSKSVYQARLDSTALALSALRTLQQVVLSGNRDTTSNGIFLGNKTPLTGRIFSAAHTFTNPTGTVDDYLSFSVINATSSAYTGTMYGGLFAPEIGSLNTQNWTGGGLKGLRLNIHANAAATGTVASAVGLEIGGDNFNKMGVTEYHAVDIHHPVTTTGVITNAGGIFINTMQSYGTNTAMLVLNQLFVPSGNWGIYNQSPLPNKLGTGISQTGRLVIDTANTGSRSDSTLTLNTTTRQVEMIPFPVTTTQLNNKVDSIYRKAGSDSVFIIKNGVALYAFRDSIGVGGGSSTYMANGTYTTVSGTGALLTPYVVDITTGIPATLIGDGSVSTAEYQYINTLSSNAQTQISGKEPTITATTSADYYRGDKTFQTLNKAAVGLGNVENTALSTWAGTTNITTVGTIATGTWNATAIGPTKGGTGQTTITTGDLLYGSGSNTIGKLGIGSTNNVLTVVGGVPTWAAPAGGGISDGDKGDITVSSSGSVWTVDNLAITGAKIAASTVDLTTKVTGTLPIANGGTGITSAGTANNVLMSTGSGWASTALGAANRNYVSSTTPANVATTETSITSATITPSSSTARIAIEWRIDMTKTTGTTSVTGASRVKNTTGAATQIGLDAVGASSSVASSPFNLGYGYAEEVPGTTATQTYNIYGQMNVSACSTSRYFLRVYELPPAGATGATGATGPAIGISVNTQTGTSYTLQASDNGKVIECTNSSAVVITLPSGLGTSFGCTIYQAGTGDVSITTSGTTIRNRQSYTTSGGQYASFSVLPTGTSNTYFTIGDMN